MTSFIQQQRTVEAAVASLQDDTRKLEELQERAALAVDGAEEARTCGLPTAHLRLAVSGASLTTANRVLRRCTDISKELKSVIKRVKKTTQSGQATLKQMTADNKALKKEIKHRKKASTNRSAYVDPHANALRYVAIACSPPARQRACLREC